MGERVEGAGGGSEGEEERGKERRGEGILGIFWSVGSLS